MPHLILDGFMLSPVRPQPSRAQLEAGNYPKERRSFAGLPVTIENPVGSVRSGQDRGGRQWAITMTHAYGYIRGTLGVDGDHLDVFLGPDEGAPSAFVITTMAPPDFSKVDEQKVMLGFTDPDEAKAAFLATYSDPRFFGRMTAMPMDRFKAEIEDTRERPRLLKAAIAGGAAGDLFEAPVTVAGHMQGASYVAPYQAMRSRAAPRQAMAEDYRRASTQHEGMTLHFPDHAHERLFRHGLGVMAGQPIPADERDRLWSHFNGYVEHDPDLAPFARPAHVTELARDYAEGVAEDARSLADHRRDFHAGSVVDPDAAGRYQRRGVDLALGGAPMRKGLVLFLKAQIPGGPAGDLFAAPVTVAGHVRHGRFVAPYAATRRRKAAQPDLINAEAEREAEDYQRRLTEQQPQRGWEFDVMGQTELRNLAGEARSMTPEARAAQQAEMQRREADPNATRGIHRAWTGTDWGVDDNGRLITHHPMTGKDFTPHEAALHARALRARRKPPMTLGEAHDVADAVFRHNAERSRAEKGRGPLRSYAGLLAIWQAEGGRKLSDDDESAVLAQMALLAQDRSYRPAATLPPHGMAGAAQPDGLAPHTPQRGQAG